LHAGLPENVLLVLDGAYAEFVKKNDYASGIELASQFDNVVITRTFSKLYGLAGVLQATRRHAARAGRISHAGPSADLGRDGRGQ
jgi:hypothetical protein